MQFDLHQNIVWFMRCEQHKVAKNGDFDPNVGHFVLLASQEPDKILM